MSDDNLSGKQIIRLSVAVCVLGTIAVILRLVARWRSNASFACDDWCIVGSLLPFYSMIACSTICTDFALSLECSGSDSKWLSSGHARRIRTAYFRPRSGNCFYVLEGAPASTFPVYLGLIWRRRF